MVDQWTFFSDGRITQGLQLFPEIQHYCRIGCRPSLWAPIVAPIFTHIHGTLAVHAKHSLLSRYRSAPSNSINPFFFSISATTVSGGPTLAVSPATLANQPPAPYGIADGVVVGHLVQWRLALHLQYIAQVLVQCIDTRLVAVGPCNHTMRASAAHMRVAQSRVHQETLKYAQQPIKPFFCMCACTSL